MQTEDAVDSQGGRCGGFGIRRLIMLGEALVGGCIALLSGCAVDSILFQPPPSSYVDGEEIQKITTADGVQISAVYLPNLDARFTLLCSHGNAEDIGLTRPSLELMRQHGYAVFAYDYRGYGTSQGKPSEQGCYQDVEAAYQYLVEELHVPADRIIIHGRSLGGALAVYVASCRPAVGLVLESAFVSAFQCVTRLPLPGDKFRNIDRIGQVHCPVLIMNGTRDQVVPLLARAETVRGCQRAKTLPMGGERHAQHPDAGRGAGVLGQDGGAYATGAAGRAATELRTGSHEHAAARHDHRRLRRRAGTVEGI